MNEIFAQFDRGETYYTKGFSIDYSGIKKNNISELKFLSDSLIRIKNSLDGTSEKLAVENISSMSFRNGSYGWLGAGIGAAVGILVGVVWANNISNENNENYGYPDGRGFLPLGVAIASVLGGTITGGIIGLNTGKYDNYCFDKYEKEKTVKIKKILKVKR